MTRRRRSAALAAAALLAAVTATGCASSAAGSASCVAPQLTLSPAAAAPGGEVRLAVEWLHSGCADTVPSTEEEAPLRDVPVEVVQGSQRAVVGTVSGTGEHFGAVLRFALPAWLRPGSAELVLDAPGSGRLAFTVVAG